MAVPACYTIGSMETGIPIDEDVVERARLVADQENRALGEIVSEWARQGMLGPVVTVQSRAGFPVLPKRGVTVTLELVNELRDDEE